MFKRFVDPRWIVALVLALNFGALGTHLWLGRTRGSLSVPSGSTLVPPVGKTADGRELGEKDFAGRPCHILRYESTRCPFCEADRAVLKGLLQRASGRSCTITLLAPIPEEQIRDIPPLPGHLLSYPSVAFVRSFPAHGTPTTVVADSAWRVVWSRTGALRESDVSSALNALD